MILLKRYRLAIVFLACAFCVAAIGYSWLPSRIAVHWNMSGQADRWMTKPFGAFILPVIGVVLTAILIAVAPKATPRIQPDTTPDAYARVGSRTNRLAGRLLILGAVATILGALVGWGRLFCSAWFSPRP